MIPRPPGGGDERFVSANVAGPPVFADTDLVGAPVYRASAVGTAQLNYHRFMARVRPSHDRVVEATADTASSMRPQNVPVNAYEAPGAFVIVAPLPAVTVRDVTIELTDGHLRFWAELRSAGPRDYAVHEWEYGGFERSIDLPVAYRADIEATLGNGQLVIRVLAGAFRADRGIHPTAC